MQTNWVTSEPVCGIETLRHEHRQIERVLTVLAAWVERGARNEQFDAGVLGGALDFIERFADQRHHAKEEGVLFEEMKAFGFRSDSGPLACMLKQHELARHLTAHLRAWLNREPQQRAAGDREAANAARAYVELMSGHISVEDSVLFPAALVRLPRGVLERIAQRCRALESPASSAEFSAAADAVVQLANRAFAGQG